MLRKLHDRHATFDVKTLTVYDGTLCLASLSNFTKFGQETRQLQQCPHSICYAHVRKTHFLHTCKRNFELTSIRIEICDLDKMGEKRNLYLLEVQ